MRTLACQSFHARYLLPRGEHGTRERLDRVLADAIGAPLERALARRGLRSDEEICIRNVEAYVRLRLAATDDALAERWSAAVADAVADAVERGGSGVVRYTSRRQALLDMVIGAAGGEFERAWAWRRLGLWPASAVHDREDDDIAPGGGEASRCVTEALLAEPGATVAVLAAAAERGSLPGLLNLLRPESWRALAAACNTFHASSSSRATPGATQHARARAAALRIVRTSALARAAADARPLPGGADVRDALAELAVLEAEPALASGPPERVATVAALAELLTESDAAAAAAAAEAAAAAGERGRAVDAASEARAGAAGPNVYEPGGAAADDEPVRSQEPVRNEEDKEQGGLRAGQVSGSPDEPTPAEPRAVPSPGARDVTHWGALLFLLHLLGELDLPEELRLAEDLARRSLRWSLHRLALLLAPLETDDPAGLALAGLGPDAAPPSEGEPEPEPAELALLENAAARIVGLLRGRLEAPLDEPDAALIERVCRRAAEVVAEPGSIELHFSVDDADTELRRAWLDLDPGWVPWLGCVVRFRYV